MSQNFRKKVNAPVKAFGNLRRNIGKIKPTSVGGKIAKEAGMGLAGLFQFLLWAVKYTALDNQVLRKFEKEFSNMQTQDNAGNEKKFASFLTRHPNLSSHILYYMLSASIIAGGKLANDSEMSNSNPDKAKIETTIDINTLNIKHTDTYEEFLLQCQAVTPYLIGYLANPEGYEANAYQDGRGIWTQGYGSTQKKDGPVGPNSSPMNRYEAYETARWHAEDYETYFILYCYSSAFEKDFSFNEFLGLASFIYNGGPGMFEPDKSESVKDLGRKEARQNKKDNRIRNDRWWELRKLYRSQGTINREQIKELFDKYPVKSKGTVFQAWLDGQEGQAIGNNLINYLRSGSRRAEGLVWRRWLEACLISGDIDPMDIMNCPISGVYEFRKFIQSQGDDLIAGDNMNYAAAKIFKKWIRAPKYWDKTHKKLMSPQSVQLTKSVMPQEVIAFCDKGKCENIPAKSLRIIDSTAITNQKVLAVKSNQLVEIGTKYLYDRNYAKAKENYLAAIVANPDNAQAYSDLSYLYLKWGKYSQGASVVRDMIAREATVIGTAGIAGAYYNAGLCRRMMAQKGISALENYRLARINMENARKIQPNVAVYQKQIDDISKEIEKISAKKKLSFNTGKKKLGDINNSSVDMATSYEIAKKFNGRA